MLPRGPTITPVPLPPSRTTMTYTYTPALSPSPSSVEAWRNKPKRVEKWSHANPTPRPGEEGSWGKGVGVGSAEWSGTTGTTGPPPTKPGRDDGNGSKVMKEEMDTGRTDGGTEPTTFRHNSRLAKADRAGEVVRETRRLGSQGSIGSKSVPNLPLNRSATIGGDGDGPRIIPASINTRPPPTPFLALPRQSPIHYPSPLAKTPEGSARPIPIRSTGSDMSAQSGHSARSLRDAFIESALHIPLDLLNEVQYEGDKKGKGEEGVKKAKSGAGRKPSMNGQVGGDEVKKAKSGNGPGPRIKEEVESGVGKKRGSGVPLVPVKTWPKTTTPKSVIKAEVHLRPPSPIEAKSSLPARSSSVKGPPRLFLTPEFGPHIISTPLGTTKPSPRPPTPLVPMPNSSPELNSDTSVSRRHQSPLGQMNGERVHTRSSDADQRGRSMGSGTSHKARMPFRIDLADSLTQDSSFDRHPRSPPMQGLPTSSTHLRVNHPTYLNPVSSPSGSQSGSGPDVSPPAIEGDRISFEIPSGTRGRLRVSLAWFRDVRSPRRWKEKGLRDLPPPLPSKDGRYRNDGVGYRSQSPRRDLDRSPPRSRPHSPIHHPPSPIYPIRSREYLAPHVERDRVRFSPNSPQELRSPTIPWSPPPINPYLLPPKPHFLSNIPQRPIIPSSFQPYPQPLIPNWQTPRQYPYPNPGHSQIPHSPRGSGSTDMGSQDSPPRPIPTQLPIYPSNPRLPYSQPAPGPSQYPYGPSGFGGGGGQREAPWSGRPPVWKRMFQNEQNKEEGEREGGRVDAKEGLIRNWRSGVQGKSNTTVFGGNGDGGYQQDKWWSQNNQGRRGLDNAQKSRVWPFGNNNQSRPPYPVPKVPTRTTTPIYRNTKDRIKAERRAQRKERRDRRDEIGDGKTTLHPFDSITRAGVPPTQIPKNTDKRGMGKGGMVSDWVKRVSVTRQPQRGGGILKIGTGGGMAWKERLKVRGPRIDDRDVGRLRRGDSKRTGVNVEGVKEAKGGRVYNSPFKIGRKV